MPRQGIKYLDMKAMPLGDDHHRAGYCFTQLVRQDTYGDRIEAGIDYPTTCATHLPT